MYCVHLGHYRHHHRLRYQLPARLLEEVESRSLAGCGGKGNTCIPTVTVMMRVLMSTKVSEAHHMALTTRTKSGRGPCSASRDGTSLTSSPQLECTLAQPVTNAAAVAWSPCMARHARATIRTSAHPSATSAEANCSCDCQTGLSKNRCARFGLNKDECLVSKFAFVVNQSKLLFGMERHEPVVHGPRRHSVQPVAAIQRGVVPCHLGGGYLLHCQASTETPRLVSTPGILIVW
jgi:hypothetical protein